MRFGRACPGHKVERRRASWRRFGARERNSVAVATHGNVPVMLSARAVRDGRCGAAAQALDMLSENRAGAVGRKSAARILMDARETPASPRRISFL
jgi:hypothetical protein